MSSIAWDIDLWSRKVKSQAPHSTEKSEVILQWTNKLKEMSKILFNIQFNKEILIQNRRSPTSVLAFLLSNTGTLFYETVVKDSMIVLIKDRKAQHI